jgi:hypothetical protein
LILILVLLVLWLLLKPQSEIQAVREVNRAVPSPSYQPPSNAPSTALKMPSDWTPEAARKWVRGQAVSRYGVAGWKCVDFIVFHESRWQWQADNPISTAYGLFQILDTNPAHGVPTQWKRFKKYLNHRYDSDPCLAKYARQNLGTY